MDNSLTKKIEIIKELYSSPDLQKRKDAFVFMKNEIQFKELFDASRSEIWSCGTSSGMG